MLDQVHGWVREAGEIALRMRNGIKTQRKPDRSVVTAADTAIETLLRAYIRTAYPTHAILGEEQGGGDPDAPYLWAIDPIDGTSSFANGLPVWGVSVGLLHHGVPVLGCFHMPLIDEWYEADLDGPALFNGSPIEVATTDLRDSEAWICVPSNVHRRYNIEYPGKVRVLGSVAAYVAYVARGTAAGALIGWAKVWDVAGTFAVLQRAGGEACYLQSGQPVELAPYLDGQSIKGPLVVGSPQAVAMLRNGISIRSP